MLAPRYYGLPSHSCGPAVWALHVSHQSEADSAVRGNFTDCGLFHLAVILSRSLPQKCTLYVSKARSALSSLFKTFFHPTQHFQQLGSRPAAAPDLWCPSEYLESETSSFLLPLGERSMRKLEPRQLLLGRIPGVEEAIVSVSCSTQV